MEELKNFYQTNMKERMDEQKREYEEKVAVLEGRLVEVEVGKDNEELRMPKMRAEGHEDLRGLVEEKGKEF